MPLGLRKAKPTDVTDLRELSAGDILAKLADVTEQLMKARQDYQTLQSIFLKLDERTTAVDQMTSEMKVQVEDMKSRVVGMETAMVEVGSKLADIPAIKAKIHAAQGDVHELQLAVERMNAVLIDIDKLFKFMKSPGF